MFQYSFLSLCEGKQVIHPGQIQAVQEEFSPSPDRVQWATELIAAFDQHQKEGKVTFFFFFTQNPKAFLALFFYPNHVIFPLILACCLCRTISSNCKLDYVKTLQSTLPKPVHHFVHHVSLHVFTHGLFCSKEALRDCGSPPSCGQSSRVCDAPRLSAYRPSSESLSG